LYLKNPKKFNAHFSVSEKNNRKLAFRMFKNTPYEKKLLENSIIKLQRHKYSPKIILEVCSYPIKKPPRHKIISEAFSPDGNLHAKIEGKTLRIEDKTRGTLITDNLLYKPTPLRKKPFFFSPNSKFLALSCKGYIYLYDINKKESNLINEPYYPTTLPPINTVSFDPHDEFLAFILQDSGTINVYNLKKKFYQYGLCVTNPNGSIDSLLWNTQGYIIATITEKLHLAVKRKVIFFDPKAIKTEACLESIRYKTRNPRMPISLSSDGNLLTVGSSMRLHDLSHFNKIRAIIKNKQLTIQQVFLLKAILNKDIKEIPSHPLIQKDWETLPQQIKNVILKKKRLKQKLRYLLND